MAGGSAVGGDLTTGCALALACGLRVLHLPEAVYCRLLDVFGVEAGHVQYFQFTCIEYIIVALFLHRVLSGYVVLRPVSRALVAVVRLQVHIQWKFGVSSVKKIWPFK